MNTKDNKVVELPEEWDKIGCAICRSLFHGENNCPQSKKGEPKFKFKSQKDMGLAPGQLPFKFRIEIEPMDDESEVIRKRSLLRLNSSKIYNLMGLSVKAHESQKAALVWLSRMADELNIDEPNMQEERRKLLPIIQTLQKVTASLTDIRKAKIQQAEAMEELATKAHTAARRVRRRITEKTPKDKNDFWVMRMPDSNVDVPIYGDEDLFDVLGDIAGSLRTKLREEPEEEIEE